MTAFAALGQQLAEFIMDDTVTVSRALPFGPPDLATGNVTPATTTIYTGPGRVKPLKRVTAGGVNVGDAKASESVFIVSVPHSATGIRPGDIVHITASSDPDLLTDTFRVVIVEDSAHTTARRLTCELVEDRS